MCIMSFSADHSYSYTFREIRKPRETKKETSARGLTFFCTYFRLNVDILRLMWKTQATLTGTENLLLTKGATLGA